MLSASPTIVSLDASVIVNGAANLLDGFHGKIADWRGFRTRDDPAIMKNLSSPRKMKVYRRRRS